MLPAALWGQARNAAYEAYIHKYKDMAIEQMERYRIPASITLAQGLLESRAGQSALAVVANNHFGIKCGGDWTGPYFVQDDDERGEHFRRYKSARESFEDHSRFLLKRRYASLFTLSPTDYKGWAYGLKAAGYATNPRYGALLVNLIERYDLARFDKRGSRRDMLRERVGVESPYEHTVYRYNKNYYIVVRAGDTLEGIAREMGVSRRKLRRYNELDKHATLHAGDILYMERKQRRADKSFKNYRHSVQAGESLYTIAQKYGIRLRSLYKMNHLEADHTLQVGEQLRVR